MKLLTKCALLALSSSIAVDCQAQPANAKDNPSELLAARVMQAQMETASVFQWTTDTERQLAAGPDSPNAGDLPEAVTDAQAAHAKKLDEIDRLARQLAELLAAVSADDEAKSNIDQQIHEGETKLAAARSQLEDLARKEAELMRRLTEEGKGSGMATGQDAGDRKPIVVSLNHGFVAPLAAPYFRGRQIRWTDGDGGLEITANQDGVPLGKAIEDGGWLAKALEAAIPDKNFVAILVAPDSVTTYYALLKELRQRKLRHSWDAWDGISFKVITHHLPGNSGGGGSGGIKTY
jgi:hypothetical protein